jgi:hypothetical protein
MRPSAALPHDAVRAYDASCTEGARIAASLAKHRQTLNEALTGANVVVDLANSPSFEDAAVLEFF